MRVSMKLGIVRFAEVNLTMPAEVLYDKTSKTIYHFKYTRDEIGNLPKILKSASDGIPL